MSCITRTLAKSPFFLRTASAARLLCNHDDLVSRKFSCSSFVRNPSQEPASFPLKNVNAFSNRSHTCGELRAEHIGKKVKLSGWITFKRVFGSALFVVLRDTYGRVQICLPKDHPMRDTMESLSFESAVQVVGIVHGRPEKDINEKMETGAVEIEALEVDVLNRSSPMPFNVSGKQDCDNDKTMRYRYLYLRTAEVQSVLKFRSDITNRIRQYMTQELGFLEVETPTLFRRSPGGAREFIVPTRAENRFYSLVQSPQQFKQMLMGGGIDRYFQFARCYRDEDGTSQRQPEFTQLDLELAFSSQDAIMALTESIIANSWPSTSWPHLPELTTPFPRMTYDQAMLEYGCDKPDLRFGMKIFDLSSGLRACDFPPIARGLAENKGVVRGFCIPGGSSVLTGKERKDLEAAVKDTSLNMVLVRLDEQGQWQSALRSKIPTEFIQYTDLQLSSKPQDLLVLVSGNQDTAASTLGALRLQCRDTLLSHGLELYTGNDFKFLWVHSFPLLEEGESGLQSSHHPFTAPHPDDVHLLDTDPLKVRALHYDIVLNGVEVGGGSIRIHDSELQRKVLVDLLKLDVADFQHMLDMLSFGCPPHGGIALGFDRYISILTGQPSIRDVLAFPKMSNGRDAITNAPCEVSPEELGEYFLKVAPASTTQEQDKEPH